MKKNSEPYKISNKAAYNNKPYLYIIFILPIIIGILDVIYSPYYWLGLSEIVVGSFVIFVLHHEARELAIIADICSIILQLMHLLFTVLLRPIDLYDKLQASILTLMFCIFVLRRIIEHNQITKSISFLFNKLNNEED